MGPKVTLHNKPHTGDLLEETQEGGCLCKELSGRQTLIRVPFGAEFLRVEISKVEIGRFSSPRIELRLFTFYHALHPATLACLMPTLKDEA